MASASRPIIRESIVGTTKSLFDTISAGTAAHSAGVRSRPLSAPRLPPCAQPAAPTHTTKAVTVMATK